MNLKSLLSISGFALLLGSAQVSAVDSDRRETSGPHREEVRSQARPGPAWERDKEWREYLKERRKAYKDWAKASRWEQDAFDRYRRERKDPRGSRYGDWGGNHAPRAGVCFYTDSNFRGDSYCLDADHSQRYVGKRYNDRISSIRLFGRLHRVVVYEHDDFGGSRRVITGDVSSLGNFNDRISSIEVR